jgi:hypothetical protein
MLKKHCERTSSHRVTYCYPVKDENTVATGFVFLHYSSTRRINQLYRTKYKLKVVYRTFCNGVYPNIAVSSTFNNLINSGIVHPTGVLIVPFMGTNTVAGNDRGFCDSQWKSPFDSAPVTTSSGSLTNLQVQIGGQNILQSNLFDNYENFLGQVNLVEQLTSSGFGVCLRAPCPNPCYKRCHTSA